MVQPDRLQITIWCMRFSCSITKVTNTHGKHVIFIAFPRQQWLSERASVLRNMYIVCYHKRDVVFTARYELCLLLNRLRCVLKGLKFIEIDEINFDIVIFKICHP